MATNHYLNQYWLNISKVQQNINLRAILKEETQTSIIKMSLKITYLKYRQNLPGAKELNKCIFVMRRP